MKKKSVFPDPASAMEDGLLAVGGNLTPELLLHAYERGIFPWFRDGNLIHWYAPPQRMVLFPSEIKVSQSMKQVLNSKKFSVTEDAAFEQVIRNCADVHEEKKGSTWIDESFIEAYTRLHQLGFAHSIEVWMQEKLVGGLYGVELGKVFCGESMFSTVSNASKLALIYLCQKKSYSLIDCQVPTPHLQKMGARVIDRNEFLSLLKKLL